MVHRRLVSARAATLLGAAMLAGTASVSSQTPSSGEKPKAPAAKAYKAPRTPDGQPDLQGIWTNGTYTPLERPKEVNKALYSREEALEVARRAAAADEEQTVPGT